jgi:hypothetical protein
MTRISSVLLAVVGIIDLDGICAFLDYLFKKLRRGVLGFIGKNRGEQLARKVVDRYEQILPSLGGFLMLQ